MTTTQQEVQDRAMAEVDATARAYKRTEAAHERSRDAAMAAVLGALRAGASPAEVARRSPFEAAYIRRRAREAGIPPRKASRLNT